MSRDFLFLREKVAWPHLFWGQKQRVFLPCSLSLLEDTLNVYWAVAEIRFIGHDLAGNGVEATGYITIYFADWADL